MTLLTMNDIAASYAPIDGGEPVQVLDGISLAVRAGEMVCVIGRSGSGKTTLLNIAAALRSPDRGFICWDDIEVGGLDAADRARRRRRHIGVVFQGANLVPTLTAAENVALPGMPRGIGASGRRRSRELLLNVGVEGRASHFPGQLSGGEQQRVAVARALFANPGLLLVDEPTANLDRTTANAIIDLLAELRSDARGILVATHDPRLEDRADLVLRLD